MRQNQKHRKAGKGRVLPCLMAVMFLLEAIAVVCCGFFNPPDNSEGLPLINFSACAANPSRPAAWRLHVSVPHKAGMPPGVEPGEAFRYYDHIPLQYELQKLLWSACGETGCPYELALAVIFRESSYRNVNGDNGNSIGYMQIQPRWHYERMKRLGVTDLSDPLSNFRVGCDLLAELLEKYNSVEYALTCYNKGRPGASTFAESVLAYMNEAFPAKEAKSK